MTYKINLLKINDNLVFLSSFLNSSEGLKLLNAIKRVINITESEHSHYKNNDKIKPDITLFSENEEHELYKVVNKYVSSEEMKYEVLIKNLMFLVKPIENFFDNVQINHQNIKLKKNRLELLFYVSNKINNNINF